MFCEDCRIDFGSYEEWRVHSSTIEHMSFVLDPNGVGRAAERPAERPEQRPLPVPRDGTNLERLAARLAREEESIVLAVAFCPLRFSRPPPIAIPAPAVAPKPATGKTACSRYSYYPTKADAADAEDAFPEGRKGDGTGGVFGEGEVFPIPASGRPWGCTNQAANTPSDPQTLLKQRLKRKRFEDDSDPRVMLARRLKRGKPEVEASSEAETEAPALASPAEPEKKNVAAPSHARFWHFVPKQYRRVVRAAARGQETPVTTPASNPVSVDKNIGTPTPVPVVSASSMHIPRLRSSSNV